MLGLGSNVLAEILAAIIVAFFMWMFSILLRLPFVFRKRRRLLQFFGITKECPRLILYLSMVVVRPFGSQNFRGEVRSFAEPVVPVVPAVELSTIVPVADLFREPLLDELPAFIRTWLGNKVHWSFDKISLIFSASPYERSLVERGSIIAVGDPHYNSAADLYTETCNPFLKMVQTGPSTVVTVNRGVRRGDVFQPRQDYMDDLAIVEKLQDTATKSTVLIAGGSGAFGTVGAVRFIVDKWEKLRADFGSEPFAICLRFQDILSDPNAVDKPVELSRFRAE